MLLPTAAPVLPLPRQAFTITYDDGFYHPSQAASVIEEAASIYSSFDANSFITESVDSSLILSSLSATISQLQSVTSIAPSASTPTSASSIIPSETSSIHSPTPSPKDTITDEESDGKGLHITAKQILPLFIILGLVALLMGVGKIWGSYANKKSRIARRRRKQNRQLLRDHMRAEREKALEIKSKAAGGVDSTSNQRESMLSEKKYDLEVDDFDAANSSYDDEIQHHGKRIVFEDEIQTTPWLEVQWRSVCRGKTHKRLLMEEKEAQKKGTWGRIKDNIGWGYDGTSPSMPQRRELLGLEAGEGHAAHVLLYNKDLPHSGSGILLPPPIDQDAKPTPSKGRRKPIPRTPPEMKAPPNSLREIHNSGSRTFTAAKELFSPSHHKNERHTDEGESISLLENGQIIADHSRASFGHRHADGSRCSLDEPQYLPPPSVRRKAVFSKEEKDESFASALVRVPTQLHVRDEPEQAHRVDERLSMLPDRMITSKTHDSILKADQVDDLLDKGIADVIDSLFQPAHGVLEAPLMDKIDSDEVLEAQEGECITFDSPFPTGQDAEVEPLQTQNEVIVTPTRNSEHLASRSRSAKIDRRKTTLSYTQAVKFDDEIEVRASPEFCKSRSAEQKGLSRSKTMTKIGKLGQAGESSGDVNPKLLRATTLGSPIVSPKSVWRERNGKWERATDVESPTLNKLTPSLPQAPWQRDERMPLSPPRDCKVFSTVRGGPGSFPTCPLPLKYDNSYMSPSVYSTLSSDTHQEHEISRRLGISLSSFRKEHHNARCDDEDEELLDERSHLRPYQN